MYVCMYVRMYLTSDDAELNSLFTSTFEKISSESHFPWLFTGVEVFTLTMTIIFWQNLLEERRFSAAFSKGVGF